MLNILQLCDSALPTGGFAFSQGLEAAWQLGIVDSQEGLFRYGKQSLESYIDGDLAFAKSFFYLAEKMDNEAWLNLNYEYAAWLTSSLARKASVQQGKAWLRVLQNLEKNPKLKELENHYRIASLGLYLVPILTSSLKICNYSFSEICTIAVYTNLRDLISASVRLGIIGPMEAGRCLHHLLKYSEKYLQDSSLLQISDQGGAARFVSPQRCSPLCDVAQLGHEQLYSRMFQS